jgi:hypothetical protein
MFKDKGIILRSAASDRVKIIMALFESPGNKPTLLIKPIVKKLQGGRYTSHNIYKVWLRPLDTMVLKDLLTRALIIADEYEEGHLDLCDILAEDEDAAALVATEEAMLPSIETAFTFKRET